jgi:hypothetical protein
VWTNWIELVVAHEDAAPVRTGKCRHTVRHRRHAKAVVHPIASVREHFVREALRQVEDLLGIRHEIAVALDLVEVGLHLDRLSGGRSTTWSRRTRRTLRGQTTAEAHKAGGDRSVLNELTSRDLHRAIIGRR